MMKRLLCFLTAGLLAGCQSASLPPMTTVPQVDLDRFMGDWYVIAHIPTWPERNAWNAIESYARNPDGSIATTFTFREGGFEGEAKKMTPTGYVTDTQSNAIWGMQFLWPFKADYRISYLTPDYRITVISREKRDYVWVMARTPEISATERQAVDAHLQALGYKLAEVRDVPQRWEAKP
jgi:apolipoprotein D and lipocalin family protein